MSWWRWMLSDSNKFVLIRSEGRGSVGKQLVLRTASTYQLLVKAPSWLHWGWLLKWWGCTVTTRCSVIVGMQIASINETAGFTYCCIPGVCNRYYWRPNAIKQVRPRAAPSLHTGCLPLVTGIKIPFVVLQGGPRLRAWRATLRFKETFAGRKERNSIAIERLVCCSNRPNFAASLTQFLFLG